MVTVVESKPRLLTAEDYLVLPDRGERRELRRGVLVGHDFHGFRHGEVCSNVHYYVDTFVRQQQIGRTLTNDSGIITERDPDTVRGADISYYSYERVPKGHSPVGYAGASPEIVFEVVSPSNTRLEINEKTAEYLQVGVKVVCIVDPQYLTVNLRYPDRPDERLTGAELLKFADLPGFSVPVEKLFE
jgi:Uma2 family endonuclease